MSHKINPVMIAGAVTLIMATAANAGNYPFEGTWDCDGSEVKLTSETYSFGQQPTLTISEVVEISDTARGVMFTDGYRIAFFDITSSSMQWHSPASGDTFDCIRTMGVSSVPMEAPNN